MRKQFIIFSLVVLLLSLMAGIFRGGWYWLPLFLLTPFLLLGYYDLIFGKTSIIRNFPVVGRMRYLMEELRPKIYQYFVESDTGGTPINRVDRETAYQRSDGIADTDPFGTQALVYSEGYEWMNHSVNPINFYEMNHHPKVLIGGSKCEKPYEASVLNISAMSYGSLSNRAIAALNGGAAIGNFAHNTGEGGIAPYHTEFGGDLIYQVGTGYFGCRTPEGNFDAELFKDQMKRPTVKMAELKLSQGAKPGHGGILPASKNTEEIAAIRGIVPHTDVLSPPFHKMFDTPEGLCEMIQLMRENANGKPVGFKLCIGNKREFMAICKAMKKTNILPDFIAIDGGEGGTGAAPPEFADSVGTPFRDGLAFGVDCLKGFDLKDEIKVFAGGKIVSSFHMFRAFAIGADVCYSARAMMLALGCIQALECNLNTCPTGVTTHKKNLVKGLIVNDKKEKVANYHRLTVESLVELLAAAGIQHPSEIQRDMLNRRVFMNLVKNYEEIYPSVAVGSMLNEATVPEQYLRDWKLATPESFQPNSNEYPAS